MGARSCRFLARVRHEAKEERRFPPRSKKANCALASKRRTARAARGQACKIYPTNITIIGTAKSTIIGTLRVRHEARRSDVRDPKRRTTRPRRTARAARGQARKSTQSQWHDLDRCIPACARSKSGRPFLLGLVRSRLKSNIKKRKDKKRASQPACEKRAAQDRMANKANVRTMRRWCSCSALS